MHRYPEETVVTADDLKNCRWRAAIEGADDQSYSSLWQALAKAASEALNEEKSSEAKALWMLADATSMMLRAKGINDPFGPIMQMDQRRTCIVGDFSDDDVSLFADVAADFEHPLVRARLAEIVWLRKRPRDRRFALMAIDAYRKLPLTNESWVTDIRQCWERALTLSLQLRAGAESRAAEIEKDLLDIFNNAAGTKGFFQLSISELMGDNNLGRNFAKHMAGSLTHHANVALANPDKHEARDYFLAAAKWYKIAGETGLHADNICAAAESWAADAELRQSSPQPSNMAAASFYEDAIQTYRKVPKALRDERKVDERIGQLHVLLEKAGKGTIEEMVRISGDSIDVTEVINLSIDSVRGKSLPEALRAFANLHHVRKKIIFDDCIRRLNEFPLQRIFASTHMSVDGRVVGKTPGAGLGDNESEDYKRTLWADAVKAYSFEITYIVQAQIWPALNVILLEHQITEGDLFHIARQSPLIPTGRERIIAKGIFAGFERDFMSAQHLLVPQVEHLVRFHLKTRGAKTTTLDGEGIETENGLSTLVKLPEFQNSFSESMAFEIEALFCDAFGPNLRNETAHGLFDQNFFGSPQAVYGWWIVFKWTLNTFTNATQPNIDSTSQPGGSTESDDQAHKITGPES